MIAVPEPGLTEHELIERAVAMRPALLERQPETERDVLQGILFRTAGSRYARDGERMQRYFRDAATYWTHVGPTMAEPLHRRVGCDRLGLPSDDIPLLP